MLQRSMSGEHDKINPIPRPSGKYRIRHSFIIPKESRRKMIAEAAAAIKPDASGAWPKCALDGGL
jgi:hypothetical protein